MTYDGDGQETAKQRGQRNLDPVAVEHRAGHVPGHRHGDALGDARAYHVPRGGSTQVVEQPIRDASTPAGGGPRLFEIADGLTVPVEHKRSNADARVRNDRRDCAAESCQRSGKPALRAPSTIRSNSLRNVGLSEYCTPSCAKASTVKPGLTLRSSPIAAAASAF